MPSRLQALVSDSPRRRLLLCALLGLMALQLAAFYLLCVHQVRLADARRESDQLQQVALADCLQYLPRSTLASCATRVVSVKNEPLNMAAAGAERGRVAGARTLSAVMPVGFSYR